MGHDSTMSAARCLSLTGSVFANNFGVFVGVTFVAYLPMVAWRFLLFSDDFAATDESLQSWIAMSVLLDVTLGSIATGLMTLFAFRNQGPKQEGRHPKLMGVEKIPAMVGCSILLGLLVGLGFALMFYPGVPMAIRVTGVIAGMLLATRLAVAIPCLLVEGRGIINSLKRSHQLVSGHALSVFGALFLIEAITVVSTVVWTAIGPASSSWIAIGFVVYVDIVAQAVAAVLAMVVYNELHPVVEDVDVSGFLDVFS